jgi:uncharacterized protein YbjT (DUF2867 family)
MYVILGASGHIGSILVDELLSSGDEVLAVLHSPSRQHEFESKGAAVEVVDVVDVEALRAVLKKGKRAFLLNPPAAPTSDTNATELATGTAIASALGGSNLEKVVLASTYGAQPGEGIGDLTTLYALEEAVRASGIPAAINRGGYYFTNLDMLVEPAKKGVLPTAFPEDLKLPMVSPEDLGRVAAERLKSSLSDIGIVYVEGPEQYSFGDVAKAFSQGLGLDVKVSTSPREGWEESFKAVGFSDKAATAFAKMTAATIDSPETPSQPRRGSTSLFEYVRSMRSMSL